MRRATTTTGSSSARASAGASRRCGCAEGLQGGVLECGRRFRDEDFARSTWDARRYFWSPKLGLRGILRLTLFRDVFIASGCGVGGGSLGLRQHALPRARRVLRRRTLERSRRLEGGAGSRTTTPPSGCSGVTDVTFDSDGDLLLKELGEDLGVAGTYPTPASACTSASRA